MAFDKCLNVITVSETKLLLAPKISEQSNQRQSLFLRYLMEP